MLFALIQCCAPLFAPAKVTIHPVPGGSWDRSVGRCHEVSVRVIRGQEGSKSCRNFLDEFLEWHVCPVPDRSSREIFSKYELLGWRLNIDGSPALRVSGFVLRLHL